MDDSDGHQWWQPQRCPQSRQAAGREGKRRALKTALGEHAKSRPNNWRHCGERQGIDAVSERREETTSAQWWRPPAAGAIVTIWEPTIAEIWRLCPVSRSSARRLYRPFW